jgi:hypothetical protein
MIEGAEAEARTIEAFGQEFRVAEKVAAMPMLRFAHLAKQGADSADIEAAAVMYDVLRAVFAPEDWDRFEDAATEARADNEDLFRLVQEAITVINARPTGRPFDSSPGPLTTTPSLTESSSFAERKAALGLVPVGNALQELAG